MILNKKIRKVCRLLWHDSKPFAVWANPGCETASFCGAENTIVILKDGHSTGDDIPSSGFFIGSFNKCLKQTVEVIPIGDELNVEALADDPVGGDSSEYMESFSTQREQYISDVEAVINKLDGRNAKVVISRTKNIESSKDPFDVAEDYFSNFPDCFRAIYYTPLVGLWIVATPERLLSYDRKSDMISTMALAGTLPVTEDQWDEKNIREHELVVDYICNTMSDLGISAKLDKRCELIFGMIKHLCTPISAPCTVNPLDVVLALHPTPAVLGVPVDSAYDTIRLCERHTRECYTGFIGGVGMAKGDLYVNLRSCKVMPKPEKYDYILFAGGGINSMSKAMDEWIETERKMMALKNNIIDSE